MHPMIFVPSLGSDKLQWSTVGLAHEASSLTDDLAGLRIDDFEVVTRRVGPCDELHTFGG
jgi:hypothetical protein